MKKNGQRLIGGYDPIWPEDFEALQFLSKSAFILWRFLIAHREDPESLSSICDWSERDIHKKIKFDRKTIRKARKELIKCGFIVHERYDRYLVRSSKRFKTGGENPPSPHKVTGEKLPQQGGENPPSRGNNYPTTGENIPHRINNRTETETEGKELSSPVGNGRIEDSEIPSLRSLYPFEDRENLKRHLMATRGFTEKQVSDTFERVYPVEYTGKAR